MRTLTKVIGTLALSAVFALSVNAAAPKKVKAVQAIDPATGLIVDKGVEDVIANCTVCHSAKFITLQRGDRQTWKDMIVWMQKTQGLWSLDMPNAKGENTEKVILDYLAKNYAPDDKIERRKNLPLTALPKNPYDTTSK
ncbi:MAG: hypothetical protein U9Q33_10520 [Campylobacterota bacterium]|nr:hypothetical protein [Campylobacterota bacterium]